MKWAEAKNQVVGEGETHRAEVDQHETDSDDDRWSLTAGVLKQKQEPEAPKPPAPKEAFVPGQNEWHFRVTPNGEIEHYRAATGKIGLRETADKIHIVERSDDAFVLALERAQSRFGTTFTL
ncbi:MAG TPA: hypothetical protein VE641_21730 [Chthoniobacterales bacterium]|nr:hypothetical protein [Chthoniobacterales bacterium]